MCHLRHDPPYGKITEPYFRNDINKKKVYIVLSFLGIGVVGAIILSFVNVHYDFLELQNFYRGYMGRRLLIQEGRLAHRKINTSQTSEKPKVWIQLNEFYFSKQSLCSEKQFKIWGPKGDRQSEEQWWSWLYHLWRSFE